MSQRKTAPKKRAAAKPTAPDTEARILAAARVVFTRAGTAGARMQDIAREAGVNQALLHYYFRSKQQLADRVLRDAATAIFSALPKVVRPDAPLEEMLRAFVSTYIDTMRKTPFLPAYLAAEAHHSPERVVAIVESITGTNPNREAPRLMQQVQMMIDARVAKGEMRPIAAQQLMINLMALLAFPFVARAVLSGVYAMDDATFERFLDERREELPRFILNGIR